MSERTCQECGGPTVVRSCADHFLELLALDHSRVQPFARFHGVNVACYLLQHPSECPASALPMQLQTVDTFLRGGLAAVHAAGEAARRRNSHRRSEPPFPKGGSAGEIEVPGPPFAYTIEDLAVDGTFPATGCEHRMHEWAMATAEPRRG